MGWHGEGGGCGAVRGVSGCCAMETGTRRGAPRAAARRGCQRRGRPAGGAPGQHVERELHAAALLLHQQGEAADPGGKGGARRCGRGGGGGEGRVGAGGGRGRAGAGAGAERGARASARSPWPLRRQREARRTSAGRPRTRAPAQGAGPHQVLSARTLGPVWPRTLWPAHAPPNAAHMQSDRKRLDLWGGRRAWARSGKRGVREGVRRAQAGCSMRDECAWRGACHRAPCPRRARPAPGRRLHAARSWRRRAVRAGGRPLNCLPLHLATPSAALLRIGSGSFSSRCRCTSSMGSR
jgi:hypothetical protein